MGSWQIINYVGGNHVGTEDFGVHNNTITITRVYGSVYSKVCGMSKQ